jgi:hypothetical protein
MIKVLEYMAASKPTVLYKLKEGRRAGDGALYAHPNDPIDFANQIERLLESEDLSLSFAITEIFRKKCIPNFN